MSLIVSVLVSDLLPNYLQVVRYVFAVTQNYQDSVVVKLSLSSISTLVTPQILLPREVHRTSNPVAVVQVVFFIRIR